MRILDTAQKTTFITMAEESKTTRWGEGITRDPVHPFGDGKGTVPGPDGKELKWLLGGKGANLARMAAIGICVPPGLTISTEVCGLYSKLGCKLPEPIWQSVLSHLEHIEHSTGSLFGSNQTPLLLSVRSGAAISMPGMMDTVLNLGLNDVTVEALAKRTGNPRFAYDSYRRFLDMFGDVVMDIPHSDFESELTALKASVGVTEDNDLTTEQLRDLVARYKGVYQKHSTSFPADPREQLYKSICAVFDSWQSDRAKKYMEVQKITGLLGTAVNVQAMVFGNMGDTSCTGVLFTRNPNTGENKLFGEYLINAQGEDVVAGIRTPKPMAQLEVDNKIIYDQIVENCNILEHHFHDMQDIEFTVQEGKLYILQTRNGKRGGMAAVEIAVDMANEGIISRKGAVKIVTPAHLAIMLHPQFTDTQSSEYKGAVVGKGLPASPGAAVGIACFTNEEVERQHNLGNAAVLIRMRRHRRTSAECTRRPAS